MKLTNNMGIRLARIIIAVIIGQTLWFKFSGHSQSIELFTELGIEPRGRWMTGIIELFTVLIILFGGKWMKRGAALAGMLMIGAIILHISILGFAGNNTLLVIMAIVVLLASIYIVTQYRFTRYE